MAACQAVQRPYMDNAFSGNAAFGDFSEFSVSGPVIIGVNRRTGHSMIGYKALQGVRVGFVNNLCAYLPSSFSPNECPFA